jgi:hypothetical protein
MRDISHIMRFALEIITFIVFIYLGFKYYKGFKTIMIGIVIPIIIVILWSILMAPNSSYRLDEIYRLVFEIILFGSVSLLLYSNNDKFSNYYLIFAFTSTVLDHILK